MASVSVIDLEGNSCYINFNDDPLNANNEEQTKNTIINELNIDKDLFEIDIDNDQLKLINSEISNYLANNPSLIELYIDTKLENCHYGYMIKKKLWFSNEYIKVKLAIMLGCDLHSLDIHGNPSIFGHVEHNNLEVMKLCIDYGIDVNYMNFFNHSTPILRAINIGNINTIEFLLENGADPNVYDCDGNSPLSIAIASKRNDLVEILFRYNVDPTTQYKNNFANIV